MDKVAYAKCIDYSLILFQTDSFNCCCSIDCSAHIFDVLVANCMRYQIFPENSFTDFRCLTTLTYTYGLKAYFISNNEFTKKESYSA